MFDQLRLLGLAFCDDVVKARVMRGRSVIDPNDRSSAPIRRRPARSRA
jgi:hypothetical protein